MFEPKCLDEFPNLKAFMCRFEVISMSLSHRKSTGSLYPAGPIVLLPKGVSRCLWVAKQQLKELGEGRQHVNATVSRCGSARRDWSPNEAWYAVPSGFGENCCIATV